MRQTLETIHTELSVAEMAISTTQTRELDPPTLLGNEISNDLRQLFEVDGVSSPIQRTTFRRTSAFSCSAELLVVGCTIFHDGEAKSPRQRYSFVENPIGMLVASKIDSNSRPSSDENEPPRLPSEREIHLAGSLLELLLSQRSEEPSLPDQPYRLRLVP